MIFSAGDEVVKCNRCGFCLSACPIYQATGVEAQAPRGRNFLARSLMNQEIPWSDDTRESLFQCLGCRACVEACFPAVETDEIVHSLRCEYHRRKGQPWLKHYLFRRLLPFPEAMARAVKRAPLLKSGATLIRALSLLPWFRKDFFQALDLLPPLPSRSLREKGCEISTEAGEKGKKVAYFGGCAFNFALPEIGAATLRLLREAGYGVVWPEHGCCGLPAFGHGDPGAARIMARKNIALFQNLDAAAIVTECASCSSFLKKYPLLFPQEEEMTGLARRFSARVKDINEFLSPETLPAPRSPLEGRVTLHDPCHLNRFQKIKAQPRNLLKRVPGLELVEMAEADWCCGGGAALNVSHYGLSMKILQRKMENLEKSKAQFLVTSCPGCYLQLKHGVKRSRLEVEVRYLTEMLCP